MTPPGEFSKEELEPLLDEAEARVNSDDGLDDDERSDVLADIDAIRKQLEKTKPNTGVLAALVTSLAAVESLTDIAEKLHTLLG